jgi:hypothetical protein
MTIAAETYLVVALAFAVFAAITALGSSLVLGAGFERLRAGFELIKSQTAFFSDAIHTLDKRMDNAEKQGSYFFDAIHKLEQKQMAPAANAAEPVEAGEAAGEEVLTTTRSGDEKPRSLAQMLWGSSAEEIRFH